MNWYKHHIGDYDTHTMHLSILEDGIYCRLLRRYYLTERPLPNDLKELARLVRARSRWEVEALGRCVNFYFSLASDGLLHNSRADREIEKYQGQRLSNRSNSLRRFGSDSIQGRYPNQKLEPIKAFDLSLIGRQQEPHHILGINETSTPLNNSKAENQEPDALTLKAQAAGITQREGELRGQFALRVAQASTESPTSAPANLPKSKFED